MKTIFLLFISLCITVMLQAQVSKTIEVTAGGLYTALEATKELNTITNLTLTGTMNSSDFGTLSNYMPFLTAIDLTRIDIIDINNFIGFAFDSEYSSSYLKSIKLPLTCKGINPRAFQNCTALISVEIPYSVKSIGVWSFYGCSSLKSVSIPPSVTFIGLEAFKGCSALTSIFANPRIPASLEDDVFYDVDKSKCTLYVSDPDHYREFDQWKDFKNIVEIPFVDLSSSSISLQTPSITNATIDIISSSTWSISSDQDWLTVNPSTGTDYQTLIITAEANPLENSRSAFLAFKVDSMICNTLIVNQYGNIKQINVTAGKLKSLLSPKELHLINRLTLTGTVDGRDFSTMRGMPYLAELDLSGVDILENPENFWMPANTLPDVAFGVGQMLGPENRLISVKLPLSCITIGMYALCNCPLLSSVTIPASVKFIGYDAFRSSKSLTSIFSHSTTPADLTSSNLVFDGIDKSKCILYVPYGSKQLYDSAYQWQDFYNVVEIPFIEVFKTQLNIPTTQGSTTNTKIVSDVSWTAISDQNWLSLSKSTGSGEDTLYFTAEANHGTSPRTAKVTVSADGVDSQTITVTQEAGTTALPDLVQNSTQFQCYPNPFTDEISIEIQNPKQTEISVDIYNLAGERIKNIATSRKDEKLDLKWNGTNDSGQKVLSGVYICKVNKQSKRLIYQGQKGN